MSFSTRPIILHCGFHKTGTSSVQHTLKANRGAIKRHANIVLKFRLKDILHATRGYSTWPDAFSLAKVSDRLDSWLNTQPDYAHRGVIVSAEELAGHMPGRDGIDAYTATLPLLRELIAAYQRRYTRPDLQIVFTTRNPDSWLHSAYWEHVKSSSLTEDFADFSTRIAPAAQLDALLDELADRIAPVPLHRFALEDWKQARLGLAAPILRLVGLGDTDLSELTPIPPINTRPPDHVLQELLDANRNISDREARKAAKQALMAPYDSFRSPDP